MTGRDDFANELLSAYLDGEVSSEERQQIAQRLAGNAEYRSELETLKALQAALQTLPRYRLPAAVHQRIMREIKRLAAERGPAPSPLADEGELLSAYFDGEVSDPERRLAEHALASSPRYRRQLDQLRELDTDLRLLSRFRLGDDFAARVQQQIEKQAALTPRSGLQTVERVRRAARSKSSARWLGWRSITAVAVTVAAVALVMVNLHDVPRQGQPQIGSSASPATISPWMLVDRRLRDRLVMVYEVSVTPEGVDQGAFFRLWKRHGIRVVDTVPVSERDQRSLLACPFMQAVERVKTGTTPPADIDHLQLYLVYCGAQQAAAMTEDLYKRPDGIASFSLALTQRSVGDGILERLRSATGSREYVGHAFHLTADFGISRSRRPQAGTFGTISYVDPELLKPLPPPGARDLEQAEQAAGDPNAVWVPDDFPVEVLFLVRNLRPSEREMRPRAVSLAK